MELMNKFKEAFEEDSNVASLDVDSEGFGLNPQAALEDVAIDVPRLAFGRSEEEREELLLGVLGDPAVRKELAMLFYYYSNYGKRSFEHSGLSLYGLEKLLDEAGLGAEEMVHLATVPLLFVQGVKDSSKEELNLEAFTWIMAAVALHCYGEGSVEESAAVTLEEVKRCVQELLGFIERKGLRNVKVLQNRYIRSDGDSLLAEVDSIQLTGQQKQMCEHLWRKYSKKRRPSATRTTLNLKRLVKLMQDCQVFPSLASRLSLKRAFLAAAFPGGNKGSLLLTAKEEDLEIRKSAFVYMIFVLALEVFDSSGTHDSHQTCFDKLLDCIRPYLHIEAMLLRRGESPQRKSSTPHMQNTTSEPSLDIEEKLFDPNKEETSLNSATPSNVHVEVTFEAPESHAKEAHRVLGNHARREVRSFHDFIDRQEVARHSREKAKDFTELDRIRGIKPPSIPLPPPVSSRSTSTHSFQMKSGYESPFDSYTVEIKTDGDVHISYFRDPDEEKEGKESTSDVDGTRNLLSMTQNKFLTNSALNDNIIVDIW